MTPEARTKTRVRRVLDIHKVYHFMPTGAGFGRSGLPDIVACVNGRFLGIECKAGKGKTTALQEREMARIDAAGGTAMVIYDTEEDYAKLTAGLLHMLHMLQIPR